MRDAPRIYAALDGPPADPRPLVGRGRSFAEAAIHAILNYHARHHAWPAKELLLGTLREVEGGEDGGQEAVRRSWRVAEKGGAQREDQDVRKR